MITMTELIQLLTAFLGSLAFAGVFNIERNKLFPAAFGGLLSWGIYLLLGNFLPGDALRYLIASFSLTIYAEIMARIMKTPTTLFVVPATIPLIPGGSLYTTMRLAVQGYSALSIQQGIYTAQLAGAIAGGIIVAMAVWAIFQKILWAASRKKFV
jgi:uncharacterized membrane protein YjjB (DUF3815 family)